MKKSLFSILSLTLFAILFLFTACEKENIEHIASTHDLQNQPEDVSSTSPNQLVITEYVTHLKEIDNDEYFAIAIGTSPSIYFLKKKNAKAKELLQLIEKAIKERQPLSCTISHGNELVEIKDLSSEEVEEWKKHDGAHYSLLTENAAVNGTPEVEDRSYSKYFSNYTQVLNLFNYLKNQSCTSYYTPETYPCITFQYKPDGCHARAHKMKQVMEQKYNKTCDKIFVYGVLNSGCGLNQIWRYHVAPLVYVGNTAYVLDPSLSDAPMSISDWKDEMTAGWSYYINKTAIKPGYYYMPQSQNWWNNAYYVDSPTLNHTNYTLLRFENYGACGY